MNRQVLLGVAIGFVSATVLFALLRDKSGPGPGAPPPAAIVPLQVPDRPQLAPLSPEARVRERFPGVGSRVPRALPVVPDAG